MTISTKTAAWFCGVSVISLIVLSGVIGRPAPSVPGPAKPETALSLCLKREDAKTINPKAMADIEDNAYMISRLLKHPGGDFERQAVEYEIPGLLFTPTCAAPAKNTDLYYRVVYLAASGDTEQAAAIIKQQIHVYVRQ